MDPASDVQRRIEQFDARSATYAGRGYDRTEAARFVASVLDPTPGSAVLDVGTGKGVLATALAARGSAVTSLDPAEATLPYPDGHFDAAASMGVLHHLANPEPVLREAVRTLSAHGELLLADFSREGFDMIAQAHRDQGGTHPESGVTIDDAAALLQQWGFSTVLRFTRHLHDIAVFTRHNHALGQDVLLDTRRSHHPHCVVCGSNNPSGLRLSFSVQPDRSVHATFRGGAAYQGYPDAIHGGLVATLLDAAMTNCLFSRGITAVTARLNIRYVSPARWYQPCDVSAHLDRTIRGVRYLSAEVRQEGRIVARATGTFTERHPRTARQAPAGDHAPGEKRT